MSRKQLVPWIGYPGSFTQQNHGEALDHGYLAWDIDVRRKRHDVEFVTLPNPRPFVTIEWAGTADATYEAASAWPAGSRFRVRSSYTLPGSDAVALSSRLRKEKHASEVVFKPDDEAAAKRFASASLGVDVRSLDVVRGMLREYYADEGLDDGTLAEMESVLERVHPTVVVDDGERRGAVWTLKSLEFDNLYGYGPGNRIDFEGKQGIIGVFGPNAIGKSSIVGAVMYALFNASDRGVGKNAHVVNAQKKSASATAVVSVAGSDHEVRRCSEKVVSRGLLTANTSLTVKQLDGEQADLTGEQRADTEKELRKLIGAHEDFVITCGSTQDDVSRFLREGATQRKAILSRFLGIDVFESFYQALNSELTDAKARLKNVPKREATHALQAELRSGLQALRERSSELGVIRAGIDVKRSDAYAEGHRLAAIVKARALALKGNAEAAEAAQEATRCSTVIAEAEARLKVLEANVKASEAALDACRSWDDIDAERARLAASKDAVKQAGVDRDIRLTELERSRKVASKLNVVPCGDRYPTCAYIRDAHVERSRLADLEARLLAAEDAHLEASSKLNDKQEEELEEARSLRRAREEGLKRARASARDATQRLEAARIARSRAQARVEESSNIAVEESDVEERHAAAASLHAKLSSELAAVDDELRATTQEVGRLEAEQAKAERDLGQRDALERVARVRELLVNAFSRRGIPNVVLNRLLPAVNAEMGRILDGVASFNVVLRAEEDTNALEAYLDDGSGQLRLLELGSGMERMMASLALRVALSNLTTLPKTDFMIIDEGFGSLDDVNKVACVSLLRSLKQWFRFILVISHTEEVKDAADERLEVLKGPEGALVRA